MTPILRRVAQVLSAAWCVPALAADPSAFQLRLDPVLGEAAAGQVEGRPIYGRGDRLTGRTDREVTMEGDAELRRAGTVVRGDRITYYETDDEVVAVGNVRIVRQGNVFTGPELQLKLDASEGFFASPTYSLPLYGGHGRADRVEFLGPDRLLLTNATYSTCRPENPDWYLRAESLTLDQDQDEGSGRSASLYFKDRRILAAPLFGFSLGNERKSGLLAPTFSFTSNAGPELLLPYYWNIAPNRDFTFYPRLTARRGLQLGGQFRYLEPRSFGDLRVERNPNDAITGTSRYFWSALHNFSGVAGWSGSINARGVSDDNYFVDYSRSILASSERILPRDATVFRGDGNWTFLARATRYQSILDARATPPYERVPQLSATHTRRELYGFDVETLFDATQFQIPLVGATEGVRALVHPRVSYPIVRPGWFVIPKLGLHLSTYSLDNPAVPEQTTLNRSVPVFSLDAGLVFERETRIAGRDVTQTLEPRVFYVKSPYRDQSAFPVFDTGVADLNFAQLFSDNTFVGNDRIADLDQLTTALVSRLIEPRTGAESLRLAFGQRLYFSNQQVTIPGVAPNTDSRSDLLLVGSALLNRYTSFDAGLQYSVRDSSVPRLNLLWRYLPADGRILNAGVRYLRDELGQIDTSWRWPLASRWMALGRINYSWLKQRIDPVTQVMVDAEPGMG